MKTSKLQFSLQELHRDVFHRMNSKIRTREHSIVHGPRHIDTVMKIGVVITRELQMDSPLLMDKVKLSCLLHDILRPLPNTPEARKLDHAIASSIEAREILLQHGVEGGTIEEITVAIREHGEKEHSSDTSWILHVADKIEILSPLAPLRRAIFVGEQFSREILTDAQAVAQYLFYFLKIMDRMSGFSFPKRFASGIPQLIVDHNQPYLRQLASELDMDMEHFRSEYTKIKEMSDNGIREDFIDHLTNAIQERVISTDNAKCLGALGIATFGIEVGNSGTIKRDTDIYYELQRRIERLMESMPTSEKLSFSQNYLADVKDYLHQWSNLVRY